MLGNQSSKSVVLRLISAAMMASLVLSGFGPGAVSTVLAEEGPPPTPPAPEAPRSSPEQDDAQSTTGPIPPMEARSSSSLEYAPGAAANQLMGVPPYLWKDGCGPTAAGMVIGYWDTHGYDWLISGSAATQTAAVDEAIASHAGAQNHYADYALPLDESPNPLAADRSEEPAGDEHASNSIADFMHTSFSADDNYYGWSWFSAVRPALLDFYTLKNPGGYTVSSTNYYWGTTFTWALFKSEIDAGRPMVLLVDSSGDGYTDHFIPAFGYDDSSGVQKYAAYNTWDSLLHWYDFRGMTAGYPWGIYGAVSFQPGGAVVPTASVLLVDDDDGGPDVRPYYASALEGLGVPYDIWDTGNSDNEPTAALLNNYDAVVWFSGEEFGGYAGPGAAGEAALATYLDATGCLLISGQDYFYDRGLRPFMQDYLGLSSATSDVAQTTVTGAGSVFGGMGPYALSYPISNYSDTLVPMPEAETAFNGVSSSAALDKNTDVYHTAYFGFPVEALPYAAARERVLGRYLLTCGVPTQLGMPSDFDGDSKTDPVVFERASGNWFVVGATDGFFAPALGFGNDTAYIPVPGDYDGDGQTDAAVFEKATGHWFVVGSTDGFFTPALGFGNATQFIPVPDDYDGDGQADPAVYEKATGNWFVVGSTQGFFTPALGFGNSSFIPVPADYDGDGKADPAAFEKASGNWFVVGSTQGFFTPALGFGNDTAYVPVPADYDGDGKTDAAVFEKASGHWFVVGSTRGFFTPALGFGNDASFITQPGDYDGDGKTDAAVYEKATGHWFVVGSTQGFFTPALSFGSASFIPVVWQAK